MKPIISIVGKSDSGKTTLIEKLLRDLKEMGVKVGTLKHDAHDFEMDHQGKDTYRHFHAGADRVMIAAAHKFAIIQRLDEPLSIDQLVQRYFHDVDLILTEGYKSENKPKIEIYRSTKHKEPLCKPEDNLIAFVSDIQPLYDVPHFDLNDSKGVATFILRFVRNMEQLQKS